MKNMTNQKIVARVLSIFVFPFFITPSLQPPSLLPTPLSVRYRAAIFLLSSQ
jgi:hypothetical protein